MSATKPTDIIESTFLKWASRVIIPTIGTIALSLFAFIFFEHNAREEHNSEEIIALAQKLIATDMRASAATEVLAQVFNRVNDQETRLRSLELHKAQQYKGGVTP